MPQPRNQSANLKTEIPGPKSRAIVAREQKNQAPGSQRFAQMAGIAVHEARGSAITDVDGNTFLDIIGGIGVNGLGHSHPTYVEAVATQVKNVSVGSFTSEPRAELFERLGRFAPAPGIDRAQLYSSGAEAVESALRLAKCHTGKHEFVSFYGGFHGKTLGALSLMGSNFKNGLGPFAQGSTIVPYADCYRCPLKLKYPSCGIACADVARKQVKQNTTGRVAAVLVEPMQGTAGNVIPPPEFLRAVAEIAREQDALLIADEMITGFGRTGRRWGVEHSGVVPDIVTLGKQFGGGFPISAILSREEIVNAKPWGNPSGSSSSYGGNPLAAAAAAAALKVIEEENLVENSRCVGAHFLKRLEPMRETYPFVGDVRGSGLFIGMELVRDRETREPLPSSVTHRLFHECVKRGLLAMVYDAHFRIQPAMTIDEATVDHAVDILTEVFDLLKAGRLPGA